MTPFPSPEVVGCYFDVGFIPPIATMQLNWRDVLSSVEQPWTIPGGETLVGTRPRRFGVRIRRQDEDAYNVALVWDSTYRQWFSLRRKEIVGTAIELILASLGTQLVHLLDQAVGEPGKPMPGAA